MVVITLQVYYRRGAYQRAEELYRRALQIREASLGTNHPDAAQTRASLAYLFTTLGQFKEAEEYYRVSHQHWQQETDRYDLPLTSRP